MDSRSPEPLQTRFPIPHNYTNCPHNLTLVSDHHHTRDEVLDDPHDDHSFLSLLLDQPAGAREEESDPNEVEEEEGSHNSADKSPSLPSTSTYSHWSESWSGEPSPDTMSNSLFSETKPSVSNSDWAAWPSPSPHVLGIPDYSCGSNWVSEYQPPVMGAGLANLGNTCFLNAVMQCFVHTVPLLQGIRLYSHQLAPSDCSGEGFCVVSALKGLSELLLASTGRVVSPWKLVDNLSYFSSGFTRFQQEDAHEFLQCFLDRLESSCNSCKGNDVMTSEADNLVKQVFGGRLVSKLKCCNCGHCSDTYEPLIDLSLEIENIATLSTALESFTKVEKLEDSEIQFTCEKCKEQVAVEKQLVLDQLPTVAAFHLKRFKNDGSFVEKIDKHVEFPLKLDLLSYTNHTQNDLAGLEYNLYAVIVHSGFSSTSGHYYCFIRSSPDTWYKFDDSKVVCVSEDFVLSQEAYILFYAKQGIAWFSSFVETLKPYMDPTVLNTSPKSVLDNMSSSPPIQNNYTFNANESSNAADEVSVGCTTGPSHDMIDDSNVNPGSQTSPIPAPLAAVGPSDLPSSVVDHEIPPSVLVEDNGNLDLSKVGAANITTPKTPSRSASPEIYREDSPDKTFRIPRNHLRSMDQVPCKRQLNKELEDSEIKQACNLIKKNMSGSRGRQLMAAIRGSYSEGSVNKKSRTKVR